VPGGAFRVNHQARGIPAALEGRDLIASANTGTGKTAAFVLPALQRLSLHRRPVGVFGPRILILSPTQGYPVFRQIGWFIGFIYLLCSAVRLARFNVITNPLLYKPKDSSKDFVGLPVPAAAGTVRSHNSSIGFRATGGRKGTAS